MSILIVDDAALIRSRFVRMVRMLGCSVPIHEAGNTRDALAQFRRLKPAIVVLDVNLPDQSGLELLRQLKAERPQAHVLMFTNDPTPQHRDRCLRAGADYFFDKSEAFGSAVAKVYELSGAV